MSHTATMFSPAWRRAFMFDIPIPPKPIMATLSVRLGARYPTPPSTCRGTIIGAMAKAAAAVAPSRTKVRREIGLASSVIARNPVGAGNRNWMVVRAGRNGVPAGTGREEGVALLLLAPRADRARHQPAPEPVHRRHGRDRLRPRHVAPRHAA